MANPIAFQPKAADPKIDLQRRLDAASEEHAEALLVAWDLLQALHDEGLLDTAHGMVTAKDTILGKAAEYAKMPEGISAIRNGVALLKVLMTIDPDVLDRLARAAEAAALDHRKEEKAPSLWELMRRMTTEDSRRGFSFMTLVVSSVGRALKR